MTDNVIPKLNILYFALCRFHEGVGGGARLQNMLNVLGRLETNRRLISYLPGEKLRVTHEQIDNYLSMTAVSVKSASPKLLKAFALGLILVYGLRHIRKSNMVWAHSPGIASGFPAFILAKIFNKPLIIDHMDTRGPSTPRFIYNRVLKNSNLVFAISRYLEQETKDTGCRNVVYAPCFTDTNVFQKDVLERVKIRSKLGINDKEIVIGYAGSFWHIMGLRFLLKAFKNLSRRNENIKLVVIGGGNVLGYDDVAGLVKELQLEAKVVLVPPQPYELMPKYLSAFDVASSPMIDCEENRAANPIKINEYMSMALPVVVSAVGQVSSIIENGHDGFLVKPGDENDLETTLEYVIQNLDLAKEIGERAREKVIKNYSRQVMLERIRVALKQLKVYEDF